MKASIIIQIIALPAIMAKLTIQIVTKSTNVNAKVTGMRAEGEEATTTDASTIGDDGKVPKCLDDKYAWTEDCPGKLTYIKIGELSFEGDTKDPRPFNVTMDQEYFRCTVNVTGGQGDYVWTAMTGFLDPDVPSTDANEPMRLAQGVDIVINDARVYELGDMLVG